MRVLTPFGADDRDKRIIALVRKGSASTDELVEAQFGELPKGLDKDEPRDDVVHFKGVHKDAGLNPLPYLFRQGYVKQDQPDTVFINGMLMSPLGSALGIFATRATYARIHDVVELAIGSRLGPVGAALFVASMFSSFRYAMLSSFVKALKPSFGDLVAEEQVHSWHMGDQSSWVLRNVFRAAAEDHVRNLDSVSRTRIEVLQAIDMVLTLMPRKHYQSDAEIIARLYAVQAKNYKQWGKIPNNMEDLVTALQDAGVRTPKFGRWVDMNFGNSKGMLHPLTAELNVGLNAARSEDVMHMYWRDVLPLMQGELLLRMGASQGYQQMGFDPDNRDTLGLPMPLRDTKALTDDRQRPKGIGEPT